MSAPRKIRVAHVITTFSAGGSTENTFLTVLGLRALGSYEPTIITGPPNAAEGGMLHDAEESGVSVDIIPALQRDIRFWPDLRAFFALMARLRAGNYDIVHTHGSKAGILGRLAGRILSMPVVTHTFHSLPYNESDPIWKRALYAGLERIAARWSHGAISVTQTVIDRMCADRVALPGFCSVVRSGMDLDGFLNPEPGRDEMRRTWGVAPDDIAIGTIGRVHAGKGQDVLIRLAPRIVAELPTVRFIIIGTGELVEPLQDEVRLLGIEENVSFVGYYPSDRMPVAISALDALIHTSDREGLARVIVQAFASRRPVISYDLDGSPEVITDGWNGRLIRPGSDDEFVSAVRQVAGDPALRELWGSRGPAAVCPAFHAESMALGTDAAYRVMLERIGIGVPPNRELAPLATWKSAR